MPPKKASVTEESTPNLDEFNDDDDLDIGKNDGKKSSSTQIRKAQNRIAQREFRLRKQQYIRDLEARVEILSGDKEERVELILLLVRNLLKENKDLRNMVKSMVTFIGEGMGSCLPRLGLNSAQLDAILNRADTDTAYEAFIALKASKEQLKSNPGIQMAGGRKKQEFNTAAFGAPPKRKRSTDETPEAEDGDEDNGEKRFRMSPQPGTAEYSATGSRLGSGSTTSAMPSVGQWDFLFPDPNLSAVAGPGPSTQWLQQAQAVAQANTAAVQEAVMTAKQPVAYPIAPTHTRVATPHSSIHEGEAQTPEEELQRSLRHAVAHMTSAVPNSPNPILTAPNNMTVAQVEERKRLQEELRQCMQGDEAADRKTEALQLITYHLNNFRINHEYMLPPSLRPTAVQRTLPHEHAIDGILFPSVRDRMILLRGKYDLVEAFHAYITEFTLHGEDVLDHRNWEASDRWLKDFAILCDDEVYAVTNRWRVAGGGVPVTRPPDPALSSNGLGNGLGTGADLVGEFLEQGGQQQQR